MKLGLALSGGGIRGAAHIGALRAFNELGIPIDAIGGTSAGSIIASLYSMGYSHDEMYSIFNYFSKKVIGLSSINSFKNAKIKNELRIDGLLSGEKIEKCINKVALHKKIKNISDIKLPLAIISTDLITNKKYIFTNQENLFGLQYIKDIDIGKAVRASCSFPGVYTPFDYKNHQFVDGGISSNLPVKDVTRLGVDKVIAIKFKLPELKQNNIQNIAMRSIDALTENLIKEEVKFCDYLIEIDIGTTQVFNTKKIELCYEAGYKQTLKYLKEHFLN